MKVFILCLTLMLILSCATFEKNKEAIGESTQTIGTVTKTIGGALENPVVSAIGDILILIGGLFVVKKGGTAVVKKLRGKSNAGTTNHS